MKLETKEFFLKGQIVGEATGFPTILGGQYKVDGQWHAQFGTGKKVFIHDSSIWKKMDEEIGLTSQHQNYYWCRYLKVDIINWDDPVEFIRAQLKMHE